MAKKENDKKRTVFPRVFTTLFTLLYLGWIFSNSLATAQQSGAASGKVRDAVQKIVDFFFGKGQICVSHRFIRKAAHFSEFALLGFLAFFMYDTYFSARKKATAICAFLAAGTTLAGGAADECIQIFADGRGPSVFDVMIDFAGGICGVFVALAVFFIAKKVKNTYRRCEPKSLDKKLN